MRASSEADRAEAPGLLVHVEVTLGQHGRVREIHAIGGLSCFSEVVEEVSFDAVGDPLVTKSPGPARWSDVTLTRPLDSNTALWKWRQQVLSDGVDSARVDGTIDLLDVAGVPSVTYVFMNGWPLRYAVLGLGPGNLQRAREQVIICHEGLQRVDR